MAGTRWAAAAALTAMALIAPPQSATGAEEHRSRGRQVTVTFVGDILLGAGVGKAASARGVEHLFAGVSDVLRSDSLTVGNLECTVSRRGAPQQKRYTFRAAPGALKGLRASGIDAVSLANNHSMDYGRVALMDTLEHLRRAGLPCAGAGADLAGASRPLVVRLGRQKVALVAASRVVPTGSWFAGERRGGVFAAYDATGLLASIGKARKKADVVAVYLHWGRERATRPGQGQREVARKCIDAGADIVVGTHPHVVQGFEYYRGKLIAYSLGNFVFTDRSNSSVILQARFRGGKMRSARVIPCRLLRYRPWVVRNEAARVRALRTLQARSFGVLISREGVLLEAAASATR